MESLAQDNENKNDMIIEMAAAIILNDIRTSVCDLSEYPSSHDVEKYEEIIPGSFKFPLHKVMDPKSEDNLVSSRRCTVKSHANISSCSSRSFTSPVLLSIAVYIHRNFASRQLIENLNKLGFVLLVKFICKKPGVNGYNFKYMDLFYYTYAVNK